MIIDIEEAPVCAKYRLYRSAFCATILCAFASVMFAIAAIQDTLLVHEFSCCEEDKYLWACTHCVENVKRL